MVVGGAGGSLKFRVLGVGDGFKVHSVGLGSNPSVSRGSSTGRVTVTAFGFRRALKARIDFDVLIPTKPSISSYGSVWQTCHKSRNQTYEV